MKEASVLDYVKSKILFWRGEQIEIPTLEEISADQQQSLLSDEHDELDPMEEKAAQSDDVVLPEASSAAIESETIIQTIFSTPAWSVFFVCAPVGLALMAQLALEPPHPGWRGGVFFYVWAAGVLVWAYLRKHWKLPALPQSEPASDALAVRTLPLGVSIVSGLLAFFAFGGNLFTKTNLFLWTLSIGMYLVAFWEPSRAAYSWREMLRIARDRIVGFSERGIRFSAWTLLVLAVFTLAAFFRFYRLGQVPPEMFSDHAEKLFDVADVLNGKTSIFFPRNTGREAFQMYLTAAAAKLFGTGLSFLSLKLGTALCGLFTLPFIYLLGKEMANRRVGLWAMAFAGIAYWPNVISRVALRFTLYPFFAAPTLFFLVRGLRRRKRNDILMAGLFLGLGLHGYSPFRFVPIVVLILVGLYLLHRQAKSVRWQTFQELILLAFMSLLVFSPLLRYALANMAAFNYRTMTRMTAMEVPLPGSAWQILFENLWDALTMFFWNNGGIWVHSVVNRPALDVVSAALF
ncbi:MAG: glycosyltransferase family 39 protein, partial [Chloroflexota bacterium]|nr:glycosyltransferase family 39 protein [Chloroflexota bacterium]